MHALEAAADPDHGLSSRDCVGVGESADDSVGLPTASVLAGLFGPVALQPA
jgi:hypothetical protein